MITLLIIIFVVNTLVVSLGVKAGCAMIKHDLDWKGAFIISSITAAAGLIPAVGFFTGLLALLICLVTIGELDFWPESVFVAVIMKAVSFGVTILLAMMLK